MHSKKRRRFLLPISLALFACTAIISFAQESEPIPEVTVSVTEQPAPEPEIQVENVVAPSDPVEIPAETATEESATGNEHASQEESQPNEIKAIIEKEQTVYVPYEKLRNTFETEGRGVFLPYAEFRKLWDAANKPVEPKADPDVQKSPIAAMITETESSAKLNGELVEVTAIIRFDLIEPGWHRLPLQLQQAAIMEAKIGDQPAQILGDNQNGYMLLIERKKDAPVRGELTLKYAKTYEKLPGRNSVSFQVPQAPMSRWEFRIPDSGVKVDFSPMIAASELPADEGAEETVFRAFAGLTPSVQIGWTPKAEGAVGLETLANVQTHQRVTIDEGVVRNRVQLNYTISRGELKKMAIEVPDDQKITGVVDDNVSGWNISQGENLQIINVELFEAAKSTQRLTIDMEKFVTTEDEFTIDVPRIKVIGVGGHQGILAVDASPGLVCEQVKTNGLVQIDPGELPQTLRIREGGFAYRLSAPAYDLQLNVEKEQPRIFARSQVQIRLDANTETMTMYNAYRIEKAGIFQLFYDIPAEMNVTSVSPLININARNITGDVVQANMTNANNASHPSDNRVAIDSWQLSDVPQEESKPKMKRLTVNLARKAIGVVGVQVQLHRPMDREELRSGTEKTVDIDLVSPVVATDGIEQKEGILIFSYPDSLRVTPTSFSGMQNVPFDQLGDKWVTSSQQGGKLAYVFASEQPQLSLQAMRRMPQVTVKQLTSVRIDDGVAHFNNKITYSVLYSGVKSLRIDVPKEISEIVRNQTNEFRDTIITPQPDDVAEGYVAWNFERGTELIGNGAITLSWEKQIPQLLAGAGVEIPIPRLVPYDVFRSWGQILLAKAETVDLSAAEVNRGLRQIDPQHDIDAQDRVIDAAYAFEYHDEWELLLNATRYDLHEVKRASIEYGLLRVVLTRANTQSVQALYRIQSVKQRLPVVLPEHCVFDLEPRINGVPVTLETDAAGQFLIPLTSTAPDKPFLLELRYTRKLPNGPTERKRLVVRENILTPLFPDDPAVQHIYAAVYVPEEYALTSWRGKCTKNFKAMKSEEKNLINVHNTPDVQSIITDMQKGIAQQSAWQDFPVDGVPYLFSTVQPDAEKSHLLSLRMRKISCINVVAFLLLLAGGVVLVRYDWRIRGIAVFGVIALYAVLAFAAPTFMFVVASVSGVRWAIAFVFILWLLWSFLKGWDTFKQAMTTPIRLKKPQPELQTAEVKAEVVPENESNANNADNANDTSNPENPEGGRHA